MPAYRTASELAEMLITDMIPIYRLVKECKAIYKYNEGGLKDVIATEGNEY